MYTKVFVATKCVLFMEVSSFQRCPHFGFRGVLISGLSHCITNLEVLEEVIVWCLWLSLQPSCCDLK